MLVPYNLPTCRDLSNAAIYGSNAPDHMNKPETDSDDEVEIIVPETDNDRREALLRSNKNGDLEQLKSGSLWESFENDFIFDEQQKHSLQVANSFCSSDDASGSTSNKPSKAEGKRKVLDFEDDDDDIG